MGKLPLGCKYFVTPNSNGNLAGIYLNLDVFVLHQWLETLKTLTVEDMNLIPFGLVKVSWRMLEVLIFGL